MDLCIGFYVYAQPIKFLFARSQILLKELLFNKKRNNTLSLLKGLLLVLAPNSNWGCFKHLISFYDRVDVLDSDGITTKSEWNIFLSWLSRQKHIKCPPQWRCSRGSDGKRDAHWRGFFCGRDLLFLSWAYQETVLAGSPFQRGRTRLRWPAAALTR